MDVNRGTTKPRRCPNALEGGKQTEDRLSSLSNDILIQIISRLPLTFAVATGCLSTRWRGLWTKLTSINITDDKYVNSFKFFPGVMNQITTPSIDCFSVKFDDLGWYFYAGRSISSWIDSLTDRHIREFKVTLPYGLRSSIPELQSFILQTQSLVSVEFNTVTEWQLPDQFILPNLTNLRFSFYTMNNNKWMGELIKACPSLERLSLNCRAHIYTEYIAPSDYLYVECSNQNLRQLIIDMSVYTHYKVIINAPKLEYLDLFGRKYTNFYFDEQPIALREARIKIRYCDGPLSDEENKLWSKLYEVVSDAEVLALDVLPLQHVSTVFRYVTRLTLDMKIPITIHTALSLLLETCPVLDVLTLRFCRTGWDDEWWTLPEPGVPNILRGIPKRLCIEIHGDTYYKQINYVEVIEHFLSNAIDLAHFKYDVTNYRGCRQENAERKEIRELEVCKRLYLCPLASTGCEVEFVGSCFKMSRKAGPKALRANGEVVYLNCVP